ncbi:MAG: GNAT family N-acetyltransferase [Clostridia bacterium]|nr:GNAT family N-acetyltransferase [Clostridia bacterium]
MQIRTERLLLRPVTLDDLVTTHAYAADLSNTRFMMFLPFASLEETAESLREAVQQWENPVPDRWEFAIVLDGRHIGSVTLYFQEDRTEAELGWVLHRDYWRKGYVSEAAQALIDLAREQLHIRRIFACCDSENIASYRTMEKLGLRYAASGTRKNRSSGDEERVELIYELFL